MNAERLGVRPQRKPFKETVYDGITYICPTWNEMGERSFDLGVQILESGQQFDCMVALARGGLTWSRDMADTLKIDHVYSMGIKSYTDVNRAVKPIITYDHTGEIKGKRVFILDEVVDSGETMHVAKEFIEEKGAKLVATAALVYKPRSSFKPDFFAVETSAWVAFPHDIREFIENSAERWQQAGLSRKQIRRRFQTIGVPKEKIDRFCSLQAA